MNQPFTEKEIQQNLQGGLSLDFKRIFSRAIRFWYLIILSLIAALAIALYQTRYSLRIYPVTASILIRDVQEVGGAEFLYKNALIDPHRNYLNEPYILRSLPLVEDVVRELNFNSSFYREGYFLTTEAYSYMPVKAVLCNPQSLKTGEFIFKLVNERQYSLGEYSTSAQNTSEPTIFNLGDSISIDDFIFCIKRIPERNYKEFIGVPFLLTIQKPSTVAESYISRLKVEWAEKGAGVINLSLTGSNPEKEIDFLSKLISSYANRDLDNKNETAKRTIEFINNQLNSIKDSLFAVEFQLERLGNSNRIKDLSAETQRLFMKLEAFEVQNAELLIRSNYYSYLEEYLTKNNEQFDKIILPSSMGISDPILSSLLSRMIDLQLNLKSFVYTEQDKNPLVASEINRMRELKADVFEALQSLKSTDKIKSEFLSKQIKTAESQLVRLPASERKLISIQRNYSLLENMYVFLMQKLSEAGISKAANTSDIEPINPPTQGIAISPKPSQNYTVAAILGLTIPLLIFVLFELFDNKVQSKEDIDKLTLIPFVGGIGHNTSSSNLTVKERSKSGVAESFRAMRSNLNYFTSNKTKQIFMVSSSISGEGKTFTTINLATVFALSGKRTLIVGADMRKPKLFEDFDRTNVIGLSTFLSGLSDFDTVVQDTAIENLFMVSGGPVPPNPSELLLTERLELFIREALQKFDFIIIDTPPLALVTDAFVISKYVDHTVFVLRQNYSYKFFIKNIDEYHRSGKIKNISILLNDIYKSGLGYGYGQNYAYHYGYSYGHSSSSYYTDDDNSNNSGGLLARFFKIFRKRY